MLNPSTGKVTVSRTVIFDEGEQHGTQQFQKAADKTAEDANVEIEIDEASVSEQVPDNEESEDTLSPLRK